MNFATAMLNVASGETVARKGFHQSAIALDHNGGLVVAFRKRSTKLWAEAAPFFAEDILAQDWKVIDISPFNRQDDWND